MITVLPQYINLYQRQRDWRSRVLRSRDGAMALLCLFAGLMGMAGYSWWNLRTAEGAVERIASEYQRRQDALSAAGAIYSTRDDYRRLQQRVAELNELIARQDVVLQRLPRTSAAARVGFSERLAAVARARVDGVWLTRIELDLDPDKVHLAGIAMSPELLPLYLLELRFEPSFGLNRLSTLTVDRTVADDRAARQGAVGFELVQLEPPARAGT